MSGKLLCAPAGFKETLSAGRVADAMAGGIRRAGRAFNIDVCPVGDGGEGTMDALVRARGGSLSRHRVTGPRSEPIDADLAVLADGTAVVELAQASGLTLVPATRRDPTATTTYGTGELIRHAFQRGCRNVLVCIGGSATVDGGAGIAQALGARFFDLHGREFRSPITGGMLRSLARFEPPPSISLPTIRVACDVTNPLCGPDGAAAVYGPQKGATPEQVVLLDQGLARLAQLVGGDPDAPGTGAAGGAGFGLMAMCGATLERGIDLVLDAVDFSARCAGATLVLTGEGRLDRQSLAGKACIGVANAAATLGVPTIAIVGSTGPGAQECTIPDKGGSLRRYICLADRFGIDRAMTDAANLIARVACEIATAL